MKDIIVVFLGILLPISLFGMAAFLIYHERSGWGWFLFCAVIVAGSLRIKVDQMKTDPRAFLKEKLTHSTLPHVSRRALKRIKYPLTPPTACNTCGGGRVTLANNSEIYGREYGSWPYIYLCWICMSYVGLHPDTDLPLGTLADLETREARKKRSVFGLLTKYKFKGDRKEAYQWLAQAMGIPQRQCHWAMFSKEQCEQAELLIKGKLK